MGIVCSTLQEDEKCIHSFSRKAWSRIERCDTREDNIKLE